MRAGEVLVSNLDIWVRHNGQDATDRLINEMVGNAGWGSDYIMPQIYGTMEPDLSGETRAFGGMVSRVFGIVGGSIKMNEPIVLQDNPGNRSDTLVSAV